MRGIFSFGGYMQLYSELGVVNACLATMGEAPVTSTSNTSPYVPAVLTLLNQETLTQQVAGWWYNNEIRDLPMSPSGEVYLPSNCIDIRSTSGILDYIKRGDRVYDILNNTFTINKGIRAQVTSALPFTDLPVVAQRLIVAKVVFDFQNKFVASSASASLLNEEVKAATIEFQKAHVKLSKINFLNNGSTGAKRRALKGYSSYSNLRGF